MDSFEYALNGLSRLGILGFSIYLWVSSGSFLLALGIFLFISVLADGIIAPLE